MRGSSNSLIKSRDSTELRPIFAGNGAGTETKDEVKAKAQRSATVELMEKLALSEAKIAGHADALAKAFAEGEEAGRAAAENAFEDDRQEALRLLERGLSAAREDLATALKGFEDLALEAALAALQVLMGDDDTYRHILRSGIGWHLADLHANSILTATVSLSDFPDSREVAELETKLKAPEGSLRLSDELAAGNCRIALKVGVVEFDMGRSWKEISNILSPQGASE